MLWNKIEAFFINLSVKPPAMLVSSMIFIVMRVISKYRRKEIYGYLRTEIGMILRELSNRKDVEIINAEAYPDHIYMYVSIPSKLSVLSFIEYLKGKSTLIIFERHANLKYKYGNRVFWCRKYYVSTVWNNKLAVYNHVEN